MDKKIYMELKKLYKAYYNCIDIYMPKCEPKYENYHVKHPPSIFKSDTIKYPISFSVLSKSSKKCFSSSTVITIVTASDSFINRYAYRKSYSLYNNQYPLYFFIGISRNDSINELLFEENKKYDDMVIFDYISSYYNNSIQFIMSMRWLYANCKNYRYILSQQSDTFVNIPYYQKHYENNTKNYPIISAIRKNEPVVRNKRSAWYVSKSVYNTTEVWPDFPLIPHIFLSKETVKKIVNASYYVKSIVFMDDVYLGILLKYSNLKNLKSEGTFILNFNYSYFKYLSELKNKYFFIHNIQPGALYYLSSKIYN